MAKIRSLSVKNGFAATTASDMLLVIHKIEIRVVMSFQVAELISTLEFFDVKISEVLLHFRAFRVRKINSELFAISVFWENEFSLHLGSTPWGNINYRFLRGMLR